MIVYFTSDLHLGHENIIKYCNRPFKSVEDMDQAIIDRWNKTVKPEDTVFILGDISFYKNVDRTAAILKALPGEKIAIWGNHDKKIRKDINILTAFVAAADIMEIYVDDEAGVFLPGVERGKGGRQKVVLCHYSMRVWNKSHAGAWQLYGHSHGSLPDNPNSLSLDVGVDCWDFTPVSYFQIKERMAKKTFKPIDHHGRKG